MALLERKVIDFLTGALFGAWLFHLGYPADVRRIFLGILIGVCVVSASARRRLFFVRLFRKLFAALICNRGLRMGLGWSFALLLIAKGTLKALALEYPLFDVGIFHQLLWNLSKGNGFLSSISRAELFLRDHLVLSLSLLTPIYRLAELSPWTLGAVPGFLTGALLAMTFGAWWFLAEQFPDATPRKRALVSSVLVLAAWGFETFYGNLHWGLHENLLGAALLSWALASYFVFSSAPGWRGLAAYCGSILLLIFAALSKESYLLVIAFTSFGLLLAEEKVSRKSIFGILSIGCLAVFVWYAQSDRDPGKNYFTRYYGYLGADLRSMIKTLVFHPVVALKGMPLKQDLRYLGEILIPFGLLPVVSWKRLSAWTIALGVLPAIGSGMLSSSNALRDPGLHYFFEFIPILGFLNLFALFALNARSSIRWGAVFIVLAWMTFWSEPWRDLIPSARMAYANASLIEKMNRIPADAVVMTQNGAGPWLAARRKAADWNDQHALGGLCPDYLVFEANPDLPIEKTQKLADVEQTLKLCSKEGSAPRAKFVDSAGHWWIYSTRE